MAGRRRVQLATLTTWSGGLNLRDDQFQLRPHETPDCENVDLLPQGGFERRRNVIKLHTNAIGGGAVAPTAVFPFTNQAGTIEHIIAQVASQAYYKTFAATDFTSMALTGTITGPIRATTMQGKVYMARNAEQTTCTWDGTTLVSLGDASPANFNESIGSASSNKGILGKCIATWHGYLLMGNTKENGVAYQNRVRFSHPADAQSWRALDWIDINPADGDEIKALVPFGDQLIVLKRRSMYMITGYGPDSFQEIPLATHLGTVSQEATAAGTPGVAFFDPTRGVFLWDGKNFTHAWAKLETAIGNNISQIQLSQSVLAWHDSRLFVSVPWGASTVNARTFVWDTEAQTPGRTSKRECWYAYNYGLGAMITWRRAAGVSHVACRVDNNWLLEIMGDGGVQDNFGSGLANYEAYLKTGWLDLGLPGIKKRYKRVRGVLDGEVDETLVISGRRNYDVFLAKQSSIELDVPPSSGLVWGSSNWGGAAWGLSNLIGRQEIERMISMGSAYAVQYQIAGPNNLNWGVNALQIPFVVKAIR